MPKCVVNGMICTDANFGKNTEAELLENTIRQVACIPGVINITNNIFMYGKKEKEPDELLNLELQCLDSCG